VALRVLTVRVEMVETAALSRRRLLGGKAMVRLVVLGGVGLPQQVLLVAMVTTGLSSMRLMVAVVAVVDLQRQQTARSQQGQVATTEQVVVVA
jgi:hypothetical protein